MYPAPEEAAYRRKPTGPACAEMMSEAEEARR
jgi:hypothetical protein